MQQEPSRPIAPAAHPGYHSLVRTIKEREAAMAVTTAPRPGEACPDPSVHERKKDGLPNAASAAALLATRQNRDSPLGSDGKLSSRSAATSLKRAQPQDLPSFPSQGGVSSEGAGKAALLSKDYKMQDLWHPEASKAGSKAALLAHRDGGKLDLWEPSASSDGQSAATLAMRNKGLSPEVDRGYTDTGRNNSMLAATQSMRKQRARAGSTPVATGPRYPDEQNSGMNSLNAARASVRNTTDGWNSDSNQAARLGNAHLKPSLFGENPDLQYQEDIDEQRHQDALHASAASYARGLYIAQKRGEVDPETSSLHDDDDGRIGTAGARTAHNRNASAVTSPNIREEAIRYIHLQDAAHKLAQERLAKVDKDMENERYREHYGYPSKSPRKSRLSMRSSGTSGGRKRAASEGRGRRFSNDSDSDDEFQARRIRQQMSQLNTGMSTVSDKQRTDDRARLMAAAEKRVHAQMNTMDEKVFMDTGKPSQAMMEQWENKAREKAERDRADRNLNPGKTHIGGGKYMDDADIQAIAAARLKPTLDELNDTADKKRARDEEFRAERDRMELAKMEEKMKSSEQKAEFKRIKEQDKAAAKREKEERKQAQRAEKEDAKARKSTDQRKSRDYKRDDGAAVVAGATLAEVADKVKDDDDGAPDARNASFEEPQTREVEPAKTKEAEKEKSGRGMFDRIASRLKKHGGDERKPATQDRVEQRTVEEPEKTEDSEGLSLAGAAALGGSGVAGAIISGGQVPEKDNASTRDIVSKHDGTVTGGGFEEEPDQKRPLSDDRQPDEAVLPDMSTLPTGSTAPTSIESPIPRGVEQDHPPVRWIDTASQLSGELSSSSSDAEEATTDRGVPAITTSTTTAAAPNVAAAGHQAVQDVGSDTSEDLSDDEGVSPAGKRIAATAGIAALGGIIAAGALGAERRRKSDEAERSNPRIGEVSGVSTDDEDEAAAQRPALYPTASVEHTGQYTFAGPAATSGLSAGRPDLERHISTIPSSSSSEDGDDELQSSDDEEEAFVGTATASRSVEQPEQTYRHVERSEETPEKDRTLMIDPTPAPGKISEPNVGPVEPSQSNAAADSASSAPAPAVKTGPSTQEERNDPQQSEKEKKGVRGFFSKFRNKSKPENKLHKEQPRSEKSTTATTGKPTAADAKSDDVITPVTTTSTGREAEGQHVGTDGPIGDSSRVSGVGGDPHATAPTTSDVRSTSPSSFRRHAKESRDLDDVSSSGADEDDYARGRGGGRSAPKLGISTDSGAKTGPTEVGTGLPVDRSISNDEQFEEARDHFDTSLAPPPAFAGQAKSESPNRTTRFSENL